MRQEINDLYFWLGQEAEQVGFTPWETVCLVSQSPTMRLVDQLAADLARECPLRKLVSATARVASWYARSASLVLLIGSAAALAEMPPSQLTGDITAHAQPEPGDVFYFSSGRFIAIKPGPKGTVLCAKSNGSYQWVYPSEADDKCGK